MTQPFQIIGRRIWHEMRVKCTWLVILLLAIVCNAVAIKNASKDDSESTWLIQNDAEYIGQLCNLTCGKEFAQIICNEDTKLCECSPEFPVYLPKNKECVKSALLGEQCHHIESCTYNDPFSICSQINHKAYCRCITGYHEIEFSSSKNSMGKNVCTKDLFPERKNVSNLLLTLGGVAVFSTLICFVLKLYVNKSHPYETTTISTDTRILSASEIVQVARSLQQANRRATLSTRESRGVTVSASRATAARAAAIILVSCHLPTQDLSRSLGESSLSEISNQNSPRSFSARQFKRENDVKMAKLQRMNYQSSRSSLDQYSGQSNSDNTIRNLEDPLNGVCSQTN